MNDDQRAVLQDMQAFIQFALEKDLDYMNVIATLGHDVNGVLRNFGRPNKDDHVHPRTTGYAKKMNFCLICEQCAEEKSRDSCIKEGGKDVCIECAERLDERKIVKFRDGSYAVSGSDGTYECGDYVAIFSPEGDEVAYWDHKEWKMDPVSVMGAIIQVMGGRRIQERGGEASE